MRIYMVSAYSYWGNFNPDDLFKKTDSDVQVGGGETAMFNIARHLAMRGHDVTVFYDIEYPGDYYGIHILPTSLYVAMITMTDFDVLVSWDATHAFRFADRAKVRALAFQLNDIDVGPFDWATDLYIHPSAWHADRALEACPQITKEKQCSGITNGVDYDRYRVPSTKVPKQVIYSSSPDRGLHHLLRIWPEVVSREPDATLHIYYDMQKWLQSDVRLMQAGITTITSERAATIRAQVAERHPSVFLHGGVNQWRLAEEQLRSCVMAYPCDPVRPTEGFSMTILEGITAGCRVLTTDADALKELWEGAPNVTTIPLPIDDDVWINKLVDAIRAEPVQPMYGLRYEWKVQAQVWEMKLLECLKNQGG